MRGFLNTFWYEEDGLQTVEIVLIIIVVVALIAIFRDRIFALLNSIFDNADSAVESVIESY